MEKTTPLKNIRELYLPVSSKLAREKQQLYWLVVSTYPSEKYVSSSVGMMTFPLYGKKHVPNHQPVMVDWLMFFFAEKQALSLVKALWLAENGAPICQKTIMITTDHLSGWNATIRGALKTHQNCLETGFQGFNPEGSWSSRNINISVKIHILTNSSTLSV